MGKDRCAQSAMYKLQQATRNKTLDQVSTCYRLSLLQQYSCHEALSPVLINEQANFHQCACYNSKHYFIKHAP